MSRGTTRERIEAVVLSWPGVTAGRGERGEYGFRYAGGELGHLHGEAVAHFGFPKSVGAELRLAGRLVPHPVAPHSMALGARRIASDEDVEDVIALLRLNYERLTAAAARRGQGAGTRA